MLRKKNKKRNVYLDTGLERQDKTRQNETKSSRSHRHAVDNEECVFHVGIFPQYHQHNDKTNVDVDLVSS